MYDVTIIGAGVIGASIARELSRYDLKVLVLEKDNDISNETTKANTGLVHAGYDATPGTNMAKFNVKGNEMYDQLAEELQFPFKRIGSLVIGFNEDDKETIQELYDRGQENGVPGLEIICREDLFEMEPNLSKDAECALYAKTGGIVGPWEFAIALMENAMDNGVELKLNTEVQDILKIDDAYEIVTNGGSIKSKLVINAAGVYADRINKMVSKEDWTITPVKGEYFLLDKSVDGLVNKVVFPCPSKTSKGIIVAPTTHGNVIVGPNSIAIDDKADTTTTIENLDYVKETAKKSVEDIPFNKTITTFSGLRANPSTGDFIIGEAEDAKGFINVAGIKSPGLSAAPAIGVHVAELTVDILGDVEKNKDFNPRRRDFIEFVKLSDEEKNELIKKDKAFGHVICRCETITEGEIVDCINRNAGATTVDGVKRRVRPGSGRCQGGFCLPKVVEILARELGKDMEEVVKDGQDSYILTGKTK